jgi:hypothetical protein
MGMLTCPQFLFAGWLIGNSPNQDSVSIPPESLKLTIKAVEGLVNKVEDYCRNPTIKGDNGKSVPLSMLNYELVLEQALDLDEDERRAIQECVGIMLEYFIVHLGGYEDSTFGSQIAPY